MASVLAILDAVTSNNVTSSTVLAPITPSPAATQLSGLPIVFVSNIVEDAANARVKYDYMLIQYYNNNTNIVTASGTTAWIATTGLCSSYSDASVTATATSALVSGNVVFTLDSSVNYYSCSSGIYNVVTQ